MQTLVLYCNDNGEEQQCLVEHSEKMNLTDYDLSESLPNFQSAGGVFLINVSDVPPGSPLITTDGYGQEILCYSVKFED